MHEVTVKLLDVTYADAVEIARMMNEDLPADCHVDVSSVIAAAVAELARAWTKPRAFVDPVAAYRPGLATDSTTR